MNSRFATYNFAGKPTGFFTTTSESVGDGQVTDVQQVSHHIIIVDRSGSMYYDLGDLKNTLLKILTLDEYRDSGMKVSLLSYSSQGDMTAHFEKVTVEQIMATGSPQQEAIRQLRVTGLTCISQALEYATNLVDDSELTCVTLHSDGFANDRSPTIERREIERITQLFAAKPACFVNTIAYRQWSDFKLLSGISNACSGVCLQAAGIKQVYDALQSTAALLAGQVTPATSVEIGAADYQVFVSTASGKILGSNADITVRGCKAEDDKTVIRYTEVDEATYNASSLPVCGDAAPLDPVYAFARTKLAEGGLNQSKYALVATRNETMINAYARSLTNSEIAQMSAGLEAALFIKNGTDGHVFTTSYGLDTSQTSVLELVNVLRQFAGDIQVDLKEMSSHYQRRGLKRIPGKRLEDGTLEEPRVKTAFRGDSQWAQVNAFEINRDSATINMRVCRGISLVANDGTNTVINDVAGVKLDSMESFNNYTIVGDGDLNLGHMVVKIGSKKAFRALSQVGAVSGDYDPTNVYTITFDGLPTINFDQTFAPSILDGVFTEVIGLRTLSSALSAMMKSQSDTFTGDQIAALKDVYVSSSLFFSPPTTNSYTDLEQALATGLVDTRLSYKVKIGSTDILHDGQTHSANKMLERFYTVTINGTPEKKPNLQMLWEDKVVIGRKTLSARTKIGPVDDAQKPIFDDLLCLEDNGSVATILEAAGVGNLAATFKGFIAGSVGKDDAVEAFSEARRAIDRKIADIYRAKVSPLVFYIGATGLIPDEMATQALPADALAERHPSLKLGKAEMEGTFFQIGDTILSVFVKGEYFTTDAGIQQAAAAK